MNKAKKTLGKKAFALSLAAMSIASLMIGCNKGKADETETSTTIPQAVTEVQPETTTEKQVIKTVKYTSKDKTMSIYLPDDSWKNTKDVDGEMVFEAEDKGSIAVKHIVGSGFSKDTLPSSKEEVLENLAKNNKDTEYYEVMEFDTRSTTDGVEYYTLVKCTDALETYFYTVGYDILVSGTDIYTVSGLVEKEDRELLEQMQTAVESFRILKPSSNVVSGEKESESESETTETDDSTIVDSMVIYDENGNAVYINKNASGVWKDSSGKTYDVQEYGVMGSDGYWYTFNQPETKSQETSSTEASGGAVSGFYDSNGNYIQVTQDANGNWVDAYGTVYYFGASGVTDNLGNYYPYVAESQSNAFYDTNGNYITVTKDANGNWVDSAGTVYYFGETGVTDASGNFYPY